MKDPGECVFCGCTHAAPCWIERVGHRGILVLAGGTEKPLVPCGWLPGHEGRVCTSPECVRAMLQGFDPGHDEELDSEDVERLELYSESDAFDLGLDLLADKERLKRDAADVRAHQSRMRRGD